ncbi:FAD-dependent oxidoreductase [Neobacillus cucumis]|uniref:FAD-dependent oxidoreductase n=1 Tax=Neobacillus cucumis TaxID=1740721 RepID=UPI0021557E65|nr:FAD-dependent oxidoreductase [Neobacillus cucumis]
MLLERTQNEAPERYVLPENSDARSIHFIGGVQSLIDAVAETIPSGIVKLETRVTAIKLDEAGAITVEADLANGKREKISASAVILALPPRIVARHIEFSPSLPTDLMTDLVNKPTWMAGQAKAVAILIVLFGGNQGSLASQRAGLDLCKKSMMLLLIQALVQYLVSSECQRKCVKNWGRIMF